MHQRNPNQDRELMLAIGYGKENKVRELIEAKANVNVTTPNNHMTALTYATARNQLNIVKMLRRAGAVINVKDSEGHTALMFAASNGHLDMVRFLLDQGAFHETRNNLNQTAAMLARRNRHEEIATFLESLPPTHQRHSTLEEARNAGRLAPGIAHAFPEEPDQAIRQRDIDLVEAASTGDEQRFHELLKAGAHINAFDEDGTPVLVEAAEGGNINIVRFLLDQPETNINAGCALYNWTALMNAVTHRHRDIVQLLLDHGAMVNIFNWMGNTALITLSASKMPVDPAIQQLLINAGATPGHLNDSGVNAAHLVRHNSRYRFPVPSRTPPMQLLAAAFMAEVVVNHQAISRLLASQEQKKPLSSPATRLKEKLAADHRPQRFFQSASHFGRRTVFPATMTKQNEQKTEAAPPPPPAVFPASDLVNLRTARMRFFDRDNKPRLYARARNKSHGNTTRGLKKR